MAQSATRFKIHKTFHLQQMNKRITESPNYESSDEGKSYRKSSEWRFANILAQVILLELYKLYD